MLPVVLCPDFLTNSKRSFQIGYSDIWSKIFPELEPISEKTNFRRLILGRHTIITFSPLRWLKSYPRQIFYSYLKIKLFEGHTHPSSTSSSTRLSESETTARSYHHSCSILVTYSTKHWVSWLEVNHFDLPSTLQRQKQRYFGLLTWAENAW